MIDQGRRGTLLQEISDRWPLKSWASGINKETGRFCIFMWNAFERGTSLPPPGAEPTLAMELEGSSEKDIEVFMTKLALVCG